MAMLEREAPPTLPGFVSAGIAVNSSAPADAAASSEAPPPAAGASSSIQHCARSC